MYQKAHSLPEMFGGCVAATQQVDAEGMEYDNSSSILTVHDSSPIHPWFAKRLAAERPPSTAQGSYLQNLLLPVSPDLSDFEEEVGEDFVATNMQLSINDSK